MSAGLTKEERLTDQSYWDATWKRIGSEGEVDPNRFRRFLFETPGARIFWKQILPRFLPTGSDKRLMHLGSAPGRHLALFKTYFGYDVHGADFSPTGLAAQRDLLARIGLDETHSILADVLSQDFRRAHAEAFDVVFSGGLIEHFPNPQIAVDAHLDILRRGGFLVISIPNLTGLYRRMMAPDVLAAHNLQIMNLPCFRKTFEIPQLKRLYCGYLGGLNLGIAFGETTLFQRMLPKAQIVVNLLARVVRIPETPWNSPFLLYIGQKR